MKLTTWLSGPLPEGVDRVIERLRRSPHIEQVAILPDVHLAEVVCVGMAIATRDVFLPEAIGGDAGCGVTTVRLGGGGLDALGAHATRILDGFARAAPVLRSRLKPTIELPCSAWLSRRVRHDVGYASLGRGNHFLELQEDEAGDAWLLVHSGSRALGPALREQYAALGEVDDSGLSVSRDDDWRVDLAYLEAWAEGSRAAMLAGACGVLHDTLGLEPDLSSVVDVSHNHVRREGDLWVHRKGACAARGTVVIPGSMGTPTFHAEGRSVPEALWSCSHGAGREMSRTEARERFGARDVRAQLRGVYAPDADLREEAPGAYKDIAAVMRAQRDLVRITRRLRPRLCWRG